MSAHLRRFAEKSTAPDPCGRPICLRPCRFAPTNIAVPAFGNQSLFGAFTKSIGEELAHFPTGPALTDDFWLRELVDTRGG